MAEEQRQGGDHKEQPIIVKKVKKVVGGGHGGAWKVAYADFVTAMMAFFIVMWILASSAEVKEQVTAYFEDPGAFSFLTGKRTIPIDLGLKPVPSKGEGDGESGEKSSSNGQGGFMQFEVKLDKDSRDSLIDQMKEQAAKDSLAAQKRVESLGKELGDALKELMAKQPELKEILSSIIIEMTKEGLKIELIESSESLFFDIGSANVRKEARDILQKLAVEIGKLPNHVVIEGHTDSRNYAANAKYTNWELSADRANAARRILETAGLWEGQVMSVTGYADKQLRNIQNPFDISNRRISIIIKQIRADQFLPEAVAAE
jgi:chemotaxis protein MotB